MQSINGACDFSECLLALKQQTAAGHFTVWFQQQFCMQSRTHYSDLSFNSRLLHTVPAGIRWTYGDDVGLFINITYRPATRKVPQLACH